MITSNLLMKSMASLVGAVLITLPAVDAAQAGTFVFDTSTSPFTPGVKNQGWWSNTRPNSDTNDNYYVGTLGNANEGARVEIRNFFTFDLSGLSPREIIESATLELTRFSSSTTNPTETLGLFDVSTLPNILNNNRGMSTPIFNDLGAGNSYGTFIVDTTAEANQNTDQILQFDLNQTALADIQNSAGGFFSIGGSLLSLPPQPMPNGVPLQFLFFANSNTVGGVQRLIVTTRTVPEPSTLGAILVTGLLALCQGKRRKLEE